MDLRCARDHCVVRTLPHSPPSASSRPASHFNFLAFFDLVFFLPFFVGLLPWTTFSLSFIKPFLFIWWKKTCCKCTEKKNCQNTRMNPPSASKQKPFYCNGKPFDLKKKEKKKEKKGKKIHGEAVNLGVEIKMISPVNTSCLHHAYLINELPFLGTEFSASSSWSSSVTCSFLGWINPSLWSDNKTAQISARRLNGLPDIRDHNLGQSWWNTAQYKRCHHGARGTGKWIHVCSASFSKSVFTICLLRMMAIWASTDDETRNELSLLLLLCFIWLTFRREH